MKTKEEKENQEKPYLDFLKRIHIAAPNAKSLLKKDMVLFFQKEQLHNSTLPIESQLNRNTYFEKFAGYIDDNGYQDKLPPHLHRSQHNPPNPVNNDQSTEENEEKEEIEEQENEIDLQLDYSFEQRQELQDLYNIYERLQRTSIQNPLPPPLSSKAPVHTNKQSQTQPEQL